MTLLLDRPLSVPMTLFEKRVPLSLSKCVRTAPVGADKGAFDVLPVTAEVTTDRGPVSVQDKNSPSEVSTREQPKP